MRLILTVLVLTYFNIFQKLHTDGWEAFWTTVCDANSCSTLQIQIVYWRLTFVKLVTHGWSHLYPKRRPYKVNQTPLATVSDHCPSKTNHFPHSRSPLVVTFDIKMYCYVFNGNRVGTLWKPGQLIVICSRLSEVWQICFPFASPPQKPRK